MSLSLITWCRVCARAGAVIGALCIVGLSHGQSAATYPRPMTPQEAQDYAHVLQLTQPGKPYVLNMADPQQYRMALRNLMMANRTPQNAPQSHAALQAAVKAHQLQVHAAMAQGADAVAQALAPTPLTASEPGGVQDLAEVSNFGDDGKSGYTATGLSSVNGGTTQTTITTELIDTKTQTIYATATNSQYGQGTDFQVPVTGTVQNAGNLAAVATIYTVVGSNPGTTVVVSTAAQVPGSNATMTAPNYCVRTTPSDPNSNCVINGSGQTQYQTTSTTLVPSPQPLIKVCFARGSQQSCDYYNSTGRPATSVFFPSAGTASFGSNSIDPSYPTAGHYTVSINPASGGTCVFSQDAPLGTGWSQPSSNTVQWSLPQVSVTNPNACLQVSGGQAVNFNFYVEVPLVTPSGGKATGYATLTSATYTPPPPPGFFGVPALYLEDSCVAAGTLVDMADGSTAAIETLNADDEPQVKTATGSTRKVLGTAKGVELHPMIRLKTNLGQQLLITRTHPVLTVAGLVMARDLQVGEHLRTDRGVATLVSVTTEKYTGQVHSLRLGWFNEPKSEHRTHSANGIFIGDSITQQQLEKEEQARLQSDKTHVMRRLPDDKWRAEYASFLATRR